jgi:hypothetical protein
MNRQGRQERQGAKGKGEVMKWESGYQGLRLLLPTANWSLVTRAQRVGFRVWSLGFPQMPGGEPPSRFWGRIALLDRGRVRSRLEVL